MPFVKKFEQVIFISTDNFDLRGYIPGLKTEKAIIAATCLADHFDENPEQHLAGHYLVEVTKYQSAPSIKYHIYHRIV